MTSENLTGTGAFIEVVQQLLDTAADLRAMTADRDRLLNDFALLKEQFAARGDEIVQITSERDLEIHRWSIICDRCTRLETEAAQLRAEKATLETRCAHNEPLFAELARRRAGDNQLGKLYETADAGRRALSGYGNGGPALKRAKALDLAHAIGRAQTDAFNWCDQIPF